MSNNSDLISRQAVIRAIRNHINVNRERADRGYAVTIREEDIKIIESAPGINVKLTAPAKWEPENSRPRSIMWRCSSCGGVAYYPNRGFRSDPKKCRYNYCPNCGVRMKEEKK